MRLPFAPSRQVEVTLGPAVPALVVRLVLGVLGVLLLIVAFAGPGPGPHGLLASILFALVVAVVLRPEVGLGALVVLVAGVRLLLSDPPTLLEVLALVVLVHLFLWTAAVAARTTWRASIEWSVLTRGLRDVAVVQVFALVLAVVAYAAAGTSLGAADLWRAVGVVSAMVLTVVVLPRASTAD